MARYNDPKHIVKIANKFPQLKIVIAHYFWPQVKYCYEVAKPFRNVYFDTSALACDEVVKTTGMANIRDVLTQSINDTPDNVLFGSDYDLGDFTKHISLIESLSLSKEQKRKVFYMNAKRLFKLQV